MSSKIVNFGPGSLNSQRSSDTANLAYLLRVVPLDVVLNAFTTVLETRDDLDEQQMLAFQRRVNDIVWPLMTIQPNPYEGE